MGQRQLGKGSLDPNLVEDGDLVKRGAVDSCMVRRSVSTAGDAWEKGHVSRSWSEHILPLLTCNELGSCQLEVMHRSAVE